MTQKPTTCRVCRNPWKNSPGTRTVSLPAGDLVVLNNYFYVHDRAPFERNEQLRRELMRQRGTFAQ